MIRIADGMRKYCGIDLNPFIVKLRNHETAASIDKPMQFVEIPVKKQPFRQGYLFK